VEGGVIAASGAAGAPQPVEAGSDELAFTGPTVDVAPLSILAVWLAAIGCILLILGRARSTR
jgi:hypothetical protein